MGLRLGKVNWVPAAPTATGEEDVRVAKDSVVIGIGHPETVVQFIIGYRGWIVQLRKAGSKEVRLPL